MKKSVLILITFLSFSFAYAQGKRFGTKITFDQGTFVSNIGVGVISPYWLTNNKISVPPLSISLEYGITKRIGLSLLAAYSASFENREVDIYTYTNTYSYITTQLRGAYHFINRDNIDLYAGLGIGYSFGSSSTNYTDKVSSIVIADPYSGQKPGGIAPTIFFGGRYYFTKQIGVFGEVGYAISYISAGLVIRLQ